MASNLVDHTRILTPQIETGQTGPAGCLIRGTVHFNIGMLEFNGGQAEFLLKSAQIILDVTNATLESPAYVQRFSEQFDGTSTTELTDQFKLLQTISASGSFAASNQGANFQAKAAAGVDCEEMVGDTTSTRFVEPASGDRIAFFYTREGGRWLLSGRKVKLAGRAVLALFGEHLQRGRDTDGLLAVLKASSQDWVVTMRLCFQPNDIYWWRIEGKHSKLAALMDVLKQKRTPETFLSNLAMAKWIAKQAAAQPFFSHRYPGTSR